MGTSKSNSGLRPGTPLLPPYAPPPDGDDQKEDKKDGQKESENADSESTQTNGNWTSAKSALTAVIRGGAGGRKAKIGRAARRYVSGGGGSSSMRKSSIGGRVVVGKLGNLLSSVLSNGANVAFQQQGIDFNGGERPEITFSKLAAQLSTKGGTVEETIANVALVEALAFMYEQFDLTNSNLSQLDNLTVGQSNEIIEVYVSSYVFERWLHELGEKIENSDLSEAQVIQLEYEIKDFIKESIKFDLKGADLKKFDFNKGEGKKIVSDIFDKAYKMIEDL